jgi:hypothetical protein
VINGMPGIQGGGGLMGSYVPQQIRSVYTQGYAEDIALLITGTFSSTVSELMQRALEIVKRLCRAKNLYVNPDKTELVLIIKRKETEGFVELTLPNTTL